MPEDFNPELDVLQILANTLTSKKTVDVGANRGEFTAALRQVGFEVECFEPMACLVEELESRFSGDPFVRIHEVACSNRDGLGNLYEFSAADSNLDQTLFSTLNPHPSYDGLNLDRHSLVQVSRLDTVFIDQLEVQFGLVKIDTEGHDSAVLEGATKIRTEALLLEFWDDQFIFNQGQVENSLSDYTMRVSKEQFPFNFLFWRGGDASAFGIVCNAIESPPSSWGNILFLNSSSVFEAVRGFCLAQYGSEKVAELRVAILDSTQVPTQID